ncbi:hypothetical protein [Litoreibacter albidus]|uniref:EthD domain-containing protein n=1 Tax=Litoreibacter albidus TaxID=670155 RepID=A0A1H3A179_9RHOB|nr:hypothetical protein [Litoreibacter albidus]SDX23447.1 hypothetical protein SAMN04488001_2700 [Litoreibacter albidus]
MLKKDIGPVTVMGFARYRIKGGVDAAEFVAAARVWQQEFLAAQPGIAMHCLLGNLKGEFADAILAIDPEAFGAMAQAHARAPSSAALMEMLDPDSIRLTQNLLLGGPKQLPDEFSCVEFGTFNPKDMATFSEDKMMDASDRIENAYLPRFGEAKSHFMGRVDETTYSEIAFVETSGAAREICNGYLNDADCLPLLEMFDPQTVDLDFWHVLA